MCSVFRRRISNQIITRLKPFLDGNEKVYFYDSLPVLIKFNQPKSSPPQFEILWKDVLKLKPELNERIHLTSLLTYLKNQDFPTKDGFTDISCETDKHEKIVFTAEQEIFTSSTLSDTSSRIETLPQNSTYFKNIPPEIVAIECSSPNIAKPFHYGHFRSTIIGNFLANICQYVGHDVIRLNYIGDWGLQYGILALGYKFFGSEEKLSQDALGHLFEVYGKAYSKNTEDPEFNEMAKNYFKKMEDGDVEALELWQKLRNVSLEKMEQTYQRLNINFDLTHSESMYSQKTKDVIDMLLDEGLATCNEDGSIKALVTLDAEDKEETVILKKRDGTSLYLSRDLAAAIDRQKTFHFDSMYYVVDSAQQKHFRNLKCILRSMHLAWESNIHHISFGRILNFSTRKGNVVFLHDILNEAQERTLERMHQSANTKVSVNMDQVADVLGISALIINDFSSRRKKEIHFSWDKVLSMNEDSGTSLQYCHARLCSIKENCGFDVNRDCELQSLVEPEAISLIAHIAKFDEVIFNAYTAVEPCLLVHYLFALRRDIGRAIRVLPVKGSNPYVARARLLLFHSAQLVLRKGLQLLGITPLSKM